MIVSLLNFSLKLVQRHNLRLSGLRGPLYWSGLRGGPGQQGGAGGTQWGRQVHSPEAHDWRTTACKIFIITAIIIRPIVVIRIYHLKN